MPDTNEPRCAGRVTFTIPGPSRRVYVTPAHSPVGDYVPAATADALLAALKDVEWGGSFPADMPEQCSSCGSHPRDGHAPDCRLAAAIALAEGR